LIVYPDIPDFSAIFAEKSKDACEYIFVRAFIHCIIFDMEDF